MNTRDPNPELTRLERLAALLRDDGVDVDAMNRDQLEQYLKDNKVDMAAPQKRFNTILKKAEARRRLEIAQRTMDLERQRRCANKSPNCEKLRAGRALD